MFTRVMVTGGAGFIGSNFIHYVKKYFPEVFFLNVDLLTYAGSLENLSQLSSDNYQFIQADICDQELMIRLLLEQEIDAIVHFAAESHVDRSIVGPSAFINTNILGTFSMLEAARKVWLLEKKFSEKDVRFHHISTDEVFGSLKPNDPAFIELTPYAPNSPYAASKASSDHLVRAYMHTYGLPITITNCSNNYGPFQFPEKLIPLMIMNALDGKPLPIYGDGKQVRDWLFVEDHCEAIWKVLQEGVIGDSYNIGGNNQVTNIEIVDAICSLLDGLGSSSPFFPHQQLIKFISDRPGHDRRYAMDISKISKELGWKPKYDLTTGLRMTVEWYLSNSNWINAIQKEKDYKAWVAQNYTNREGK